MKDILLVGVGLMGRPYVKAARDLGLRIRAVESSGNAAVTGGMVDDMFLTPGDTDEVWVQAAHLAVRDSPPDGVIAFSETHVLAAALLQDSLQLPGPSLHAAVLSRNKALQRGCFEARGLGQPEYHVTPSLRAARDWALPRLPVVIKPLNRAGSEGVELVPDTDSFDLACARRSSESPLLVEVAVDGPEYSWEGIVHKGRICFGNTTAKETTGAPHFVEVCHRAAVLLPPDQSDQVDRMAQDVVAGLGMETGIVHLEFRLSATGPSMMEVAVRTPGDFILDMLGLTYGFDWFEMIVRLAIGAPLPLPPPATAPIAYAASLFIIAAPGTVVALHGLRETLAHPGVVAADFDVAVGHVVPATTSSADRVGWALLRAETRQNLEATLRYVRSTLRVETSPTTDA